MTKKIIAVVGSTGAQGGSLVRAILKDGEFAARALTRKTTSEKAEALKAAGAEVVEADIDNVDQLTNAIQGAYGLYCVTNFWEHFSTDKERQQAQNMAQAAKNAGIKHVIWSTLEDVRKFSPLEDTSIPILQGKFKVPHFDMKGECNAFFKDLPTTYMLASFYWENFIYFGTGPKKGPDGKQYITLPMGKVPMAGVAVEDLGKTALGIFKHPETIGKHIGVAGDHLTIDEYCEKMSKALGIEIGYNAVSFDAYRGFGFPGAADLGNMFQFYHDFVTECNATRSVDEVRKLNPEVQNFDQWLAINKDHIPIDK